MDNPCIFNKKVICSDCGDCDICDLNSTKKCNNCGKCLQLEGYDIRAVEIDDILENDKEIMDFDELNKLHDEANEELIANEEFWDYIDDIKELKDLTEEEGKLNVYEEFPGLLIYNKIKENSDSQPEEE